MSIRAEAERCAKSAQGVGLFVLDDLALGVAVIELGFKFWQACSGSTSSPIAMSHAICAKQEPVRFRKARRRVRRSAVTNKLWMSEGDLDKLTHLMLDHVTLADDARLGVCCSEPIIADEEFDD